MKKLIARSFSFFLVFVFWLFLPINKQQGQFIVSDINLLTAHKIESVHSKVRHSEQIAKLVTQINEARKTVQGIRDVKRDIERTYDFATSLVNLADLRKIKEFNMINSIECLVGFSFDPRNYVPRFNRNRNRYFMGCPSIETALMMQEDLSNMTSRYGWEKMMQQKGLMQSQYMHRLIEQMKKTNERLERELRNEKNQMTKGEYIDLLLQIEERNKKILEYMQENDRRIAELSKPTPTETELIKTKYQQTILLQHLAFSTK